MHTTITIAAIASLAALPYLRPARAQQMTLEEYAPRSTLVVPEHIVKRARFPFIDVHSHQEAVTRPDQVDRLVHEMDELNLHALVNLSGGTGADLARNVKLLKARYPSRFIVFANLDFSNIDDPRWGERAAAQLETDVKQGGAQGLKIFKDLGLDVKDSKGRRVPVDDPRLDLVWEKAGALGIPVLIHSGEPKSLFDPMDAKNERWLELKLRPGRGRPPDRYPTFEQVMGEQRNMFRKHPRTKFIAAHLAWLGGDLTRLGAMLDTLPNVYTELGAVMAELGRQPRAARKFLVAYQDRVMLGKDTYAPKEYWTYFRILETQDEYFDYYRNYAASWKLYGVDLPDDVLKKIYYKNALKVIPGLDRSGFPN